MDCRYCRYSNPEGAHRCARCGRPFQRPPRSVPLVPGGPRGETAFALTASVTTRPAAPPRGRVPPPEQQWLFEELRWEASSAPRVIPFPASATRRGSRATIRGAGAARDARRYQAPVQQQLDFLLELPTPSPLRTAGVQPSVNCEVPVAPLSIRVWAAVLDLALILAAWALFVAIFRLGAGAVPLTVSAAAVGAGTFALIWLFYRLLAALSGASPGMRWSRLRWLDFDGQPAGLRQRLGRVAAGTLSLLPAGFGFLWVLFDEERLSFCDYISRTFVARRREPEPGG